MAIETIREFVRGERDWGVLTSLGVSVELNDSSLRLEEPPNLPIYEASVVDVATGFLAQWARGRTLQAWARILLGTGMVDLACLEDHREGELLLEAVWSGAEGAEFSDETLDLIRGLLRSDRG